MYKRLIAFSSILSLLLSLSLIPASASAKAGAKCTKLGSKSTVGNKTFTCIKSGKKSVWNKGVKNLVTESNTSPTTQKGSKNKKLFTPWASTFETSFLVQSALDATDSYFGKVSRNNSYDIMIDPAITQLDKSWITGIIDYVNGSFPLINRDKLKVFLGATHEWGRASLRSQNVWVGDPNSPFACSDGSRDAYCADKNVILLIYSDIYAPNSNFTWDAGRRSTPAHEIFHTIQYSLNTQANPNFVSGTDLVIPRWLMEGSANFYGYYVNEKLGFGTYQSGRRTQINDFPEYKKVTPLSAYSSFNDLNPYGIGQAATEYIIASVGFESLLNIFKFTGTEGTFSAGFKKATGIELSDFYSKFESARSSMQIGQ
jgi:hypothetical protein